MGFGDSEKEKKTTAPSRENCVDVRKYELLKPDAEVYTYYNEKDKVWIPCYEADCSSLSQSKKSVSEMTILTEDTYHGETTRLLDHFDSPICYMFLCFNYQDGHAYVTEGTMKVLDYYIDKIRKNETYYDKTTGQEETRFSKQFTLLEEINEFETSCHRLVRALQCSVLRVQ